MSDQFNPSPNINLEFLRKEAKSLLKQCREGDAAALSRIRTQLPRLAEQIKLADVHHALARENGCANWAELKRHDDPLERFLVAIRGGALREAKSYLAEFAEMAEESIHAACAIGDSDAVSHHLKIDAALAAAEHGGWPPLLYASASPLNRLSSRQSVGIMECVKVLLDAGVDPDTYILSDPSDPGSKVDAAYLAMSNPNLGVMLLLTKGKTVGDIQEMAHVIQRDNPVLAETFKEHLAIPEIRHWMVEQKAEFRRLEDAELSAGDTLRFIRRETPVFPEAAVEIFRSLLQRGYDPNRTSSGGQTMLHGLARIGNAAVAELLLVHGAEPDRVTPDGRTALMIATREGNRGFADTLRAHGASAAGLRPTDALLGACLRLDAGEARSILNQHPDVFDQMSRRDIEVLLQAAARNNLEQVRLMAQLGFNLGGFGEGGATALHVAAWHGHVDMVRLLLEFHAPVDILDTTYGSSPLAWAIHGSTKNRAFLLSRADAIDDYAPIIAALRGAGGNHDD